MDLVFFVCPRCGMQHDLVKNKKNIYTVECCNIHYTCEFDDNNKVNTNMTIIDPKLEVKQESKFDKYISKVMCPRHEIPMLLSLGQNYPYCPQCVYEKKSLYDNEISNSRNKKHELIAWLCGMVLGFCVKYMFWG